MKTKKSTKGFWIIIIIAAPLLTLLTALGGAKLILSGVMQENNLDLIVCIAIGLVALVLSMFGAFRANQKKFLWGMLFALAYCIVLMLSNLLFFGEGYGDILMNVLSVFAGGIIGSMLGGGKRRKIA